MFSLVLPLMLQKKENALQKIAFLLASIKIILYLCN